MVSGRGTCSPHGDRPTVNTGLRGTPWERCRTWRLGDRRRL